MGGKVLELETDWFNDAVRQARIDGRKCGERVGVKRGETCLILAMLSNGMSPEEISANCNLPLEEVLEIEKTSKS